MFFYLTTLNLAWFLNETAAQVEPPKEGQSSNAQAVQAVESWKHSYFLCHNYVLNGLVDDLYNVYSKITTTKELQEWLERKGQQAGSENTYAHDSTKANMVEQAGSSSKSNSKAKGKGKKENDKKGKGKHEYLTPKAGIMKQKFQRTCYNCSNNSGWWVDTGETHHVCAEKSMFHSFRVVDNGEKLYMGNSATADLKGQGDVILKMTSEKELKLTNVLYGCSQESCV
uniref:Retrovirus-related Pol polyprotein from transposon TNT 1-94-like beta-barrel domain-containing protein n=1 Tax=Tanacetum cinerariifolium TaxID=118510 RepID=A0A699HWY2_TANCI|nr:hypothetical protein [Tanacetum cinerariifolium]